MEYHDPLNASLVLPFQRPRDGRSTLPILPSLPQLGLLRRREPNPRRHHGTPPSPRKIRRCCADRLNPPGDTRCGILNVRPGTTGLRYSASVPVTTTQDEDFAATY